MKPVFVHMHNAAYLQYTFIFHMSTATSSPPEFVAVWYQWRRPSEMILNIDYVYVLPL